MNVEVAKPQVQGVSQEHAGLIVVRAPLDPAPNAHWKQLFETNPHFTGWPISMAKPRIYGSEAEIRVTDDAIENGVQALRARVDWVNEQYALHVQPDLDAKKQAHEQAKAQNERRIEDAQRKIDETADGRNAADIS